LLIFVAVARSVSLSDAGLFALAWSLSYVLATVLEGGLSLLSIREVARDRARTGHYLGAMLGARAAAFLPMLVVGAAVSWLVGLAPAGIAVTAAACAAAYLQMTAQTTRDLLVALNRLGLLAAASMAETAAKVVAATIVVSTTGSLAMTFVASAVVSAASATIIFERVARYATRQSVGEGLGRWKSVLVEAVPFGLFVSISALFFHVHVLVASLLLPLASVALLQAGMRLFFAVEYLPEAASRWAYPRLSRVALADSRALASITTRFAAALLTVGVVIAVVLVLAADDIIPTLFGTEYRSAASIVALLGLAVPARFLAHAYGVALSAGNAQSARLAAAAAALILALVIEIPLIIAFGVEGAALALVVAGSVLTIAYFAMARRKIESGLRRWPPVAAIAFSAAGLLMTR